MAVYTDRRGRIHSPQSSSVIKDRAGVFTCCSYKDHLLLIWPNYAQDVPELPGGGIDAGESLWEANAREFKEETGFDFLFSESDAADKFSQTVYFYAEDVDEYWNYHQSFFLLKRDFSSLFFEGPRATPEQGTMRWVPFAKISDLPLQFMHRKALISFGIVA